MLLGQPICLHLLHNGSHWIEGNKGKDGDRYVGDDLGGKKGSGEQRPTQGTKGDKQRFAGGACLNGAVEDKPVKAKHRRCANGHCGADRKSHEASYVGKGIITVEKIGSCGQNCAEGNHKYTLAHIGASDGHCRFVSNVEKENCLDEGICFASAHTVAQVVIGIEAKERVGWPET